MYIACEWLYTSAWTSSIWERIVASSQRRSLIQSCERISKFRCFLSSSSLPLTSLSLSLRQIKRYVWSTFTTQSISRSLPINSTNRTSLSFSPFAFPSLFPLLLLPPPSSAATSQAPSAASERLHQAVQAHLESTHSTSVSYHRFPFSLLFSCRLISRFFWASTWFRSHLKVKLITRNGNLVIILNTRK